MKTEQRLFQLISVIRKDGRKVFENQAGYMYEDKIEERLKSLKETFEEHGCFFIQKHYAEIKGLKNIIKINSIKHVEGKHLIIFGEENYVEKIFFLEFK